MWPEHRTRECEDEQPSDDQHVSTHIQTQLALCSTYQYTKLKSFRKIKTSDFVLNKQISLIMNVLC
jgi:hypothetical protein